ncbi:MAG TPA: hypothetical protein VEB64_08860 [Azospirillaceae bacterium]|nr:hypothetical protein [Azospirillaceae bacterium]
MHIRPDHHVGSLTLRGMGVLLAVGLLAGCSSVSDVGSSLGLTGGGEEPAGRGCPKVAIVRDAAAVTQFRPGKGRDLTDVVSHAELADFKGGCEYAKDGVTVDFDLRLVADRGPALQGNQASYRYFVAITQPDRTVAAKREFETTVAFEAGATRAGSTESLAQTIPLPQGQDAGGWEVLLGFQLTPEELDYNRRQIAKR